MFFLLLFCSFLEWICSKKVFFLVPMILHCTLIQTRLLYYVNMPLGYNIIKKILYKQNHTINKLRPVRFNPPTCRFIRFWSWETIQFLKWFLRLGNYAIYLHSIAIDAKDVGSVVLQGGNHESNVVLC